MQEIIIFPTSLPTADSHHFLLAQYLILPPEEAKKIVVWQQQKTSPSASASSDPAILLNTPKMQFQGAPSCSAQIWIFITARENKKLLLNTCRIVTLPLFPQKYQFQIKKRVLNVGSKRYILKARTPPSLQTTKTAMWVREKKRDAYRAKSASFLKIVQFSS